VASFDDSGAPENGSHRDGRSDEVEPAVHLSRVGAAEPQAAHPGGVDQVATVQIQADPARPVPAQRVDDAAVDRVDALRVNIPGNGQDNSAGGVDPRYGNSDVAGQNVQHEHTPKEMDVALAAEGSVIEYPDVGETNPVTR
jgi:hypothetical protein